MTLRQVLKLIGQVALSLLSLAICMAVGMVVLLLVMRFGLNSSVTSRWPLVLIAGLLLGWFGLYVFCAVRSLGDNDLEDFRK
jgi:hypothetical protein